MSQDRNANRGRRAFLLGGAALVASPAIVKANPFNNSTVGERDLTEAVRRNVSSFRTLDWRPYFNTLRGGAILVDIDSRAGHYWSPTPSMVKRYPEWPPYVPPGPNNPLGTRALHLSWTYYRIHGTHDTRKIGRQSSNGCIGLYNEHIEELYEMARVGTQVLLI